MRYGSSAISWRAWLAIPCSRAAMCPSGAMNAPYDDAAGRCAPQAATPVSIPQIASSQIPPIDSRRASGLSRAWKKPCAKPSATALIEVEPSRSAAAASTAPPVARL